MRRISTPIDQIREHYTVVVVGSGYGGGVTASRLARAGQDVCLLERGREFLPGDFPKNAISAAKQMNLDTPHGHRGDRLGLFNFHLDNEMNVLRGCGLGGTSLINANVSIRPDNKVFEKPGWPAEVRAHVDTLLEEGYQRAWTMLEPRTYPKTSPPLAKMVAHQVSGEAMKQPWRPADINVHFEDRVNAAGLKQRACTLCGDCVSGCNHEAKNTTQMNYLPDAHANGAEIFCEVSVSHIERKGGRWLVHYSLLGARRELFDSPEQFVSADLVVLSAGTLGSTEILLRSRVAGLPTSDMLGQCFSGNGDALGFSYSSDRPIHGVGFGDIAPGVLPPVGPCITSIIDMRNGDDVKQEMILEEGNIPGPIGALVAEMLGVVAISGDETNPGILNSLQGLVEEADSVIRGSHHGAVDRTQTYLVMAMDDSNGELSIQDDQLRISWPGVGSQQAIIQANERMREATAALKGVFVHNPIWSKVLGDRLITVHPLGGCIMGDTAVEGVVDHRNRVFSNTSGQAVHEGLYVSDGAVVPTALAVNPLLTISALAERCVKLIAQERGWVINYSPPSSPLPEQESEQLGLRFTETMHGFWSTQVTDDPSKGAELGRQEDNRFRFVLTIQTNELDAIMKVPATDMHMTGTVVAPALSDQPLMVNQGVFNLFVPALNDPETQHMRYRMTMTTEEGREYYMEGQKNIRDDPGFDAWSDTTTLYITLHDGPDRSAPVMGSGVLRLTPTDFTKQLTTMQVLNASNRIERLGALARFGRLFARDLLDLYGGVLAKILKPEPQA